MHLPGISIGIYPSFYFSINLVDLPWFLLGFAGIIALQIALSRRERWWPGLILPAAWLLWTLAVTIPQMVSFIRDGDRWFRVAVELGLPALAMENVPNLILLAVYAVCHRLRWRRERRQLKKTQIDDL
ncbi:hypothetical protein [uncultured Oscillibacter sp.]|uniref:hypothetical protein n=1 Tax=uncultured Oscillibacter sp. TaxID=876091 RepID=UPI00260FEB47|nr:hypothetical protein [uncultured Oscillibacter sp.]